MPTWTIHPHSGVGPLRLGMTQDEVAAAIGRPDRAFPEFDGSLMESRGVTAPRLFYRDGRLGEIDIDSTVPGVMLGDLDVFRADPAEVVRRLLALNGGPPLAGTGSVLFLAAGINTGGFVDERTMRVATSEDDDGERGLSIFAPGTFDDLADGMTPLALTMP